ncbi:zinc finger CCCH domain-containing protein 18-like isoform X1 [Cloeon dipterum]|uniref:zinc finger CCCH domain-containing protein 18-like isoform X1 n=1 Tax=Cloeon dipterum TaxID=197152 RepID=UPI00321F822E
MSSGDEMSSPREDAKVDQEENPADDSGEVEESNPGKFDPLSKEDLSDVSDLESHDGLQESSSKASPHKTMQDQLETELDFEADEEPAKRSHPEQKRSGRNGVERQAERRAKEAAKDEDNDLEEGECTDGEDARPEEESKPVCRFYNRGQCTWGANCRFVHPGVTDKGNYTMFDMVRPLVPTNGPPGADPFFDRQFPGYGPSDPVDGPPLESAWERGLRHAKEMMKKATRRKETDQDFEEKKMNLGLGQEDLDKENDFYIRQASPLHRFEDEEKYGHSYRRPSREDEYYAQESWKRTQDTSRRQIENLYKERQNREFRESMRGKGERSARRSRDSSSSPGSHHSRGHHSSKYKEKQRKPTKQKADEWSDPWMRQKSPTRKDGWKRSHSSESSYSSSSRSSSGSSSSSDSHYSNHAPAPKKSARDPAYKSSKYEAPVPTKPREPREPPMTKRHPPVDDVIKKGFKSDRGRKRHHERSSSVSGSSSDSNSSYSSSSEDERPAKVPRRADTVTKTKAMDALKMSGQKQQIRLTLKENEPGAKPEVVSKKRAAEVAPVAAEAKVAVKKSTSRREELLKQLKAVEDAIKRKKSKAT